jgi:hypothetical protein
MHVTWKGVRPLTRVSRQTCQSKLTPATCPSIGHEVEGALGIGGLVLDFFDTTVLDQGTADGAADRSATPILGRCARGAGRHRKVLVETKGSEY